MVHGDQMHGSVSAAHRCRGNGPNESTGDAELGEWLKLGGGGGGGNSGLGYACWRRRPQADENSGRKLADAARIQG